MADIIQVNGRPVVDYMARDYDSLLAAMYALVPQKLPEWKDFQNEADFGNVMLQLFAYMGDILSYYQDRVANESFLATAQTRRSVIEHLRLIGYRLATAAPAAASLSLTVPARVTDSVTVNKGDAFGTKSDKNKPSVRFEYTRDAALQIDFSTVPVDAATNTKTFAGIPVEEGKLFKDEVLGASDGSANQRFTLARPGLILHPGSEGQPAQTDIVVLTQSGATIDTWTLQESLAFSRAGQRDYVVEIDENDQASIVFGDGSFGAIPANGATVRATYRAGGGAAGNVAPQTIVTIVNGPQLALLGAKVSNPAPASGGAERESIEHAVQHAPAVFRSLKRAVTAADYEALALNFKGVGKVRARAAGWNRITLYVAPEGGGHVGQKVSDVLKSNLQAYFEDKRMLTHVIEIADVDYVAINVTAEIGVQSYYARADVTASVKAAASRLLDFDSVDFGQTIYLSKFYEVTESVEGVEYVNLTEFRRGDEAVLTVRPTGKIELGPNEIPVIPSDPGYESGIRVEIVEGGF